MSYLSRAGVNEMPNTPSAEAFDEALGNILDNLCNMEIPARFHNTDWAEYAIKQAIATHIIGADREYSKIDPILNVEIQIVNQRNAEQRQALSLGEI